MKRAWLLSTAALLLVAGAACSRHPDSPELAALDKAYSAGLLTKVEYEAKKAALSSQSSALGALESAYKSGVLTKEEYDQKRTALLAQSETLAALEKARAAGVVTKEEYEAKRAALLGSAQMTPAPSTTGPAASQSSQGQPALPSFGDQAASAPVNAYGGSTPAPSAPPPTPAQTTGATVAVDNSHTFRMKLAKAVDAQGFERPMTSMTVLVPVDWQSEGQTTWNIRDRCNTIQTVLRASGPDGRGYEVFPMFNWQWSDTPQLLQQAAQQQTRFGGPKPCDVMPPMSAQDYVKRNLRQVRPNAQLVGFEPAPKLMEALAGLARQTEAAGRQYNLTQRVKFDAVKARLKYEVQGKPMEEWLSGVTITTGTLGPSMNMQTMQMTQAWTYNCVGLLAGVRAPAGQLDASEKLFDLIGSTLRTNPEWQARVTANAQQLQATELKGVRDRSAIMAKSAEDTRNTLNQMYENKNRSDEHISTQYSQYMRGVETYRNPATGDTVDLSNQYGNAWVNNRGEYLLSDQAGFDPNTIFKDNQGWKPMEHVKK